MVIKLHIYITIFIFLLNDDSLLRIPKYDFLVVGVVNKVAHICRFFKNANDYYCELCDFTCNKKSNYNKHLSTRKHLLKQNETNETNLTKLSK